MEVKVKRKAKPKLWWLFALGLLLLSGLSYFVASSYSFLALIGAGLALTIMAYLLLFRLAGRRPRLARVLCLAMSLCLGLGTVAAALTGGIVLKACKGSPGGEFDYLLVLGCGVDGDRPSLSLQDRIDAAYRYLAAHPQTIAVVSGGKGDGENISEALCMYNELTALGIGKERIWMEDKAASTEENFAFSLKLIQERTGARPEAIGVVSSEYHLYRSAMFAAEQGITAYGIPAKTTRFSLFLNYFLREIVMVWYYSIF